jgi:hypothetical protein
VLTLLRLCDRSNNHAAAAATLLEAAMFCCFATQAAGKLKTSTRCLQLLRGAAHLSKKEGAEVPELCL